MIARRLAKDEQGVMLILTLVLVTVLWFMLLGLTSSSVRNLQLARQGLSSERACWAAESGLRLAVQALLADPDYTPVTAWTAMLSKKESYRVLLLKGSNAPVAIPSDCVYLRAYGKDRSGLIREAGAVVRLANVARSYTGQAVYVSTKLEMSGGAYIDSFDSTVGPTVRGTLGSVVTNQAVPGAISMAGGSYIQGGIQVGVGGKTGAARPTTSTVNSTNTVWKDVGTYSLDEAVLTSPLEFPPVSAPAAGTTDYSVGKEGLTLAPGAYRNLSASAGGEIRLSGGTYVFESIKLSGGSKILYDSTTPCTIYVRSSLDSSNGQLINSSGKSANLTIMLAKGAEARLSGGSQAYAVIYGPEANVTLSGQSDFFFSVVASTLKLSGGSRLHYDSDLLKNPPGVLAQSTTRQTSLVSWQRL